MAENKQSSLESKGIAKRKQTIVKNNYNKDDVYSIVHPDAISNGDPQGKSSGHGGHTHTFPDHTKPQTLMDYSGIDTQSSNIGGLYDIEGRNGNGGRRYLQTISKYNAQNQYGVNSIDTSLNVQDGQVVIK